MNPQTKPPAAAPPHAALGLALRKARENMRPRMKQEDAAARLGILPSQLSRYESGQRQAPLDFIRRAVAIYGVPIAGVSPSSDDMDVSRETPNGEGASIARVREVSPPYGIPEIKRAHSRILADAARRLSAMAAELMQEAHRALNS